MPGSPLNLMHAAAACDTPMSSENETDDCSAAGAATAPIAPADRERSFLCPEPGCNGRFHRKFTLREHLKTHTGEKPYQCAIPSCGKLFSTSGNLSRHRRLHMLKRLECPILDCTRVFTKQEKLLRHLKVHMGSAAHACSFPGCTKTFSTSGNLSRHQRTQHRANGGASKVRSDGGSRQATAQTASQPSMVAMMYAPSLKSEYLDTTPIDAYMERVQYHQSSAYTSLLSGQDDGISHGDLMVLLDCLFVNEGSRADPAAAFNSSVSHMNHIHTRATFEVYF